MSDAPAHLPGGSPAAHDGAHRGDRSPSGRRRAWRAAPRGLAPTMTPMIDVVFLLLMYFLLAADFSAPEEIYRLDLPDQRTGAGDSDPFRLDQEPLRIRVRTIGDRPTDLRLTLDPPYESIDDAAALARFLRGAIAGEGRGLLPVDHPILIEPDATTMWEHAVIAFDAAVRTGYTNVIFVRLARP